MLELYNTFCPRRDDGVFLPQRVICKEDIKRPNWCMEDIVEALKKEFEPSQLERGSAERGHPIYGQGIKILQEVEVFG